MDAPTPRMGTLSPIESSPPASLSNPIIYVLNYHTNSWPYRLAASLHTVYGEQIDGLIGVYSNLDLAQDAGTKWLERRTEELEELVSEEMPEVDEEWRAKLLQQGWSRVVQGGTMYDIWINGIYPGQSNVTVKVRASVVFGRDPPFGETVATQSPEDSPQEFDRIGSADIADLSRGDGSGEETIRDLSKRDAHGVKLVRNGNVTSEERGSNGWKSLQSLSDRNDSTPAPVEDPPTPYAVFSDDSVSEPEEPTLAEDSDGT